MGKWLSLMAVVSHFVSLCWGEMGCRDYLVSGPGGVPDSALSASPYYPYTGDHCNPACGRLYMYRERSTSGCLAPNAGAWCSGSDSTESHIQVDFADSKKIVGVVIQQRYGSLVAGTDVRTYHVLYSENGVDWEYVTSDGVNQTFYNPINSQEEHYSNVTPPVVARYVRIRPLTWMNQLIEVPCLKFDVIGCSHVKTVPHIRRRRFAYLPLPAGTIRDVDVITQGHAKDLGECSLRCHRDVTCRSYSYSNASRECKVYSVQYTRQRSKVGEQSISDEPFLYYFDMTLIDQYTTTDPTTGLTYKVITRRYNKEDAMTVCADLEMRLLVVNSLDKLNLLLKLMSASLILDRVGIIVNGGWYEVGGMTKWWDGGDPPQPLNATLVPWNTTVFYGLTQCLIARISMAVVVDETGRLPLRYNGDSITLVQFQDSPYKSFLLSHIINHLFYRSEV